MGKCRDFVFSEDSRFILADQSAPLYSITPFLLSFVKYGCGKFLIEDEKTALKVAWSLWNGKLKIMNKIPSLRLHVEKDF